MYTVQLEVFEGPMDLLLHLVEKHQVDIYTISISTIADQFIEYVERGEQIELENIGEFLVMASLLMRIKVRQLLPRFPVDADPEEEQVNEEEALVERLIEYRMFKEVASYLEARLAGELPRVYYRDNGEEDIESGPEVWAVNLEQLVKAFVNLNRQTSPGTPVYDLVPQGDVDVEEKMEWLYQRIGGAVVVFQDLFATTRGKRERIALFLALLELIQMGRLIAEQTTPRGAITVRRYEVMPC